MALIELRIPHPYQYTPVEERIHPDEDAETESARQKGLRSLDKALNQGYSVIDCHSIKGERVYLLHKPDRGESPARRNPLDGFGIDVPGSDNAV